MLSEKPQNRKLVDLVEKSHGDADEYQDDHEHRVIPVHGLEEPVQCQNHIDEDDLADQVAEDAAAEELLGSHDVAKRGYSISAHQKNRRDIDVAKDGEERPGQVQAPGKSCGPIDGGIRSVGHRSAP